MQAYLYIEHVTYDDIILSADIDIRAPVYRFIAPMGIAIRNLPLNDQEKVKFGNQNALRKV